MWERLAKLLLQSCSKRVRQNEQCLERQAKFELTGTTGEVPFHEFNRRARGRVGPT